MFSVFSCMIIYRSVKSKLRTQADNRLNYFPFPDDVLRVRSELNSIKCKIGRKSTGRVVRVKFVISICLIKVHTIDKSRNKGKKAKQSLCSAVLIGIPVSIMLY